jgi:glycosyltransferase involved in cell wall biosynthesis
MIEVAALTSGRSVPSRRFRVAQHIGPLQDLGVRVTEYLPAISKYAPLPLWPQGWPRQFGYPLYGAWQAMKLAARIPGVAGSWRSRVTWLERELVSGAPSLESLLKRPLVFDVDDAIWLSPPFGRLAAKNVARHADVVLAGNRYVADWFGRYARDVRVLPTAVDTDRFRPPSEGPREDDGKFTLGWTGISWNLPYLAAIEEPLARFLLDHAEARLLVVADTLPVLKRIPADRLEFEPWNPAVEAPAIRRMDVGLMPLPDNAWTRGKASFKMLQYMACGLPVVVSPVGMNVEVLALGQVGLAATSPGDWYQALLRLYQDRELGRRLGRTGRALVESRFSRAVVSKVLADVFNELDRRADRPRKR